MKGQKVFRKVGRPGAPNRPNDDDLLNLYANFTAPQLATLYGVSPSTVRNWVSRTKKKQAQALLKLR